MTKATWARGTSGVKQLGTAVSIEWDTAFPRLSIGIHLCDPDCSAKFGRRMIVSGGEDIYTAEVENVVFAHPGVADVALIGVPDETWGETVKAIAVQTGAGTSVAFAEVLPATATGKALKRELREPFWRGRERHIH